MKYSTLACRSLVFYWRTHLAIVLAAATATAVLTGALAVGDSVRYSLSELALLRLGKTALALRPQDRFFRQALADDMQKELAAPVCPVLMLRGIAAAADGIGRANDVQVVGADDRFWSLGGGGNPLGGRQDVVVLNERLAERLGCGVGDEVVLRIHKPSALPSEAPLSTAADAAAGRFVVAAIASKAELGLFSLQAGQLPPYNAFVPLLALQGRVDLPGRANALLVAETPGGGPSPAQADVALRKSWQLADAGLELRRLERQGALELRSDRIFLEPPVVAAAKNASPGACGVLAYFVNELRVGDRAAPYSMVAAIGPLDPPDGPPAPTHWPPELTEGQVAISRWLADDLQARPGQQLALTYFVLGPMRKLLERTDRLTIRAVVPTGLAMADRELMPKFPGLAGARSCRDWKPGIPVNLEKIRKKDEQYWERYGGAPKALVALSAGERMWANRFGQLTAVRYPLTDVPIQQVASRILSGLKPASVGLFFVPVRQQALAAGSQTFDFGWLLVGLSCFLIVAALLLAGLLFALGIDQRREQVGVLLALGLAGKTVRRLLLAEGGVLAVLASAVGAAGGLGYARAVIHLLVTVWAGAVAHGPLGYNAAPVTLPAGACAGLAAAGLAMWLVLRSQASRPARQLLAGEGGQADNRLAGKAGRRALLVAAMLTVLSAGVIGFFAGAGRDKGSAAAFFSAGGLLLVGGLMSCAYLLAAVLRPGQAGKMTILSLALRNAARRRWRSMAVVGLVACGSFLVVSVAANRHDPGRDVLKPSSGTGGWALFGESSLPVFDDLNDRANLKVLGLSAAEMSGVSVLPLRVRDGDDASCLNLYRAQEPRLLGVPARAFQDRGAFTFVDTVGGPGARDPWLLLEGNPSDGAIPAIGDDATVFWALGRKIGDTLRYVDERGQERPVRIVGVIAGSILQGSLLVSQENLVSVFPSESAWRAFLIDTPAHQAAAVAGAMERALEDVGLSLVSTGERLAAFQTVQNTYLSIFQSLGGLGLLLGTVGLGLVVTRNVLARRGELAMLRAVGFTTGALCRLTFLEHAGLLAMGLVCGAIAAIVAVLPAIRSPGADIPYVSLSLTLAGVAASGAVWVYLASVMALRGPLLDALRNQ